MTAANTPPNSQNSQTGETPQANQTDKMVRTFSSDEVPSNVDYLLIGGGLASATAAETLRARDPNGSIVIVGQEDEPPYNRPPLSKEYLRGEINAEGTYGNGGVYVYEPGWYAEHRVTGLAKVRADVVDPTAKTVTLGDGRVLHYGKLLLATGGRPRRLDIPGADLPGVFVLRTLADATALREAIAVPNTRVVVLGSGFIGLESAAQALFHGAKVTIIEPMTRLWQPILPTGLATYFEEQYTRRGATTFYGYVPLEFRAGENGRVGAVVFRAVNDAASQPQEVPADVVLMGVGIDLNTELAAAAGLTVDPKQGIVVDDHLRTSAPDIYAAGDIAAYPDPLVGTIIHVEHWENAIESGKVAAENMTGGDAVYAHVPYFFSDQFDLAINVLGLPTPMAEVVIRGTLAKDQFTAFFVLSGRLIAVLTVNDDSQFDLLKALVAAQAPIADVHQLSDPAFDLASLRQASATPEVASQAESAEPTQPQE